MVIAQAGHGRRANIRQKSSHIEDIFRKAFSMKVCIDFDSGCFLPHFQPVSIGAKYGNGPVFKVVVGVWQFDSLAPRTDLQKMWGGGPPRLNFELSETPFFGEFGSCWSALGNSRLFSNNVWFEVRMDNLPSLTRHECGLSTPEMLCGMCRFLCL